MRKCDSARAGYRFAFSETLVEAKPVKLEISTNRYSEEIRSSQSTTEEKSNWRNLGEAMGRQKRDLPDWWLTNMSPEFREGYDPHAAVSSDRLFDRNFQAGFLDAMEKKENGYVAGAFGGGHVGVQRYSHGYLMGLKISSTPRPTSPVGVEELE